MTQILERICVKTVTVNQWREHIMLSYFKQKRRNLMKLFSFLGVILVAILMFTCTPAQSKSNYRISWDPDATGKTASWNVYLEQRDANTGFILQPGVNRSNTNLNQFTSFMNIPAATTEVIVELTNDGKYLVAGVEAMSSSGVYTDLGLNTTPYQKGDAPPIPSGVNIQRLP